MEKLIMQITSCQKLTNITDITKFLKALYLSLTAWHTSVILFLYIWQYTLQWPFI